jgi:hypothetical protein
MSANACFARHPVSREGDVDPVGQAPSQALPDWGLEQHMAIAVPMTVSIRRRSSIRRASDLRG